MPRLPIIHRGRELVLATLALALAAPAFSQTQLQQPTVETMMYHMQRDAGVAKAAKHYRSAVQGATLYYTCPKEYGVDAEKKTRYERVLHEKGIGLRKAFDTAHQSLTGKLPGGAVKPAIESYITGTRDQSSVATTKAIQRRGCRSSNFKKLDSYFEQLHALEKAKQQQNRNESY